MTTTTGFQIAFLVFTSQFLAMLLANAASTAAGWPPASLDLLGQFVFFALAIALFTAIGPLRRFAAEELRRPVPDPAAREVMLVATAKVASPLAVTGLVVAVALATGSPEEITRRIRFADPAHAWEWTLSPAGLAQMVILAWLVGPVVEELIFRGLLYRAWERQWGWVPAMLLTSACFSLFHPSNITSSFIGSIVYVCVMRRTGTLRAPIVVHILFNFLVSWPLLGQVILTPPHGDPAQWSSWAAFLACLALTVIGLPAYLLMSLRDARAPATP